MIKYMKALGGLLLASALVACGGGGGSAGTTGSTGSGGTGGTGGSTGGTPAAQVADFAMYTDKTTISNTGADQAKLTVVAVDANRNVVSGAAVTVSTDASSVFVPAASTTDDTGTYTGNVQIGGDKSNRDITVTVTVNGIVKRTTIHVGGSKLVLSALPAAPQPNQSVAITANLKDAAGNAIQGTTVTFGGTIPGLQSQTAPTDASGNATVTVTAPATAGVYTVTATGGGTPAPDYQLQVFASGSSVPTAVIPAGVTPSLAASPNVLAVNAVNSTTNKSILRFVILDAANNPIPNVRVRFDDMTTGLPAQGASIASGGSTLFTDSSGTVSTQYIAGQNSSPTNGITIRACYSANDFASGTDCPAWVNVTLTVAGQALSVSIGDDNKLASENGMYIKRFAVTVADSAGRAVANAPVDISVDLTHFAKGDGAIGSILPLDTVPLSTTDAFPALNSAPAPRVWCPNEDYNRNGVVDATTVFGFGTTSENYNNSTDSNGQPTLEPRKSDLLINYDTPSVTTTDANGVLVINVRYSQRFATWLAYKVRVTANVAGSQGMTERQFITDFLDADKSNGSFLQPPYGTQSCVSPN